MSEALRGDLKNHGYATYVNLTTLPISLSLSCEPRGSCVTYTRLNNLTKLTRPQYHLVPRSSTFAELERCGNAAVLDRIALEVARLNERVLETRGRLVGGGRGYPCMA